MWPDGCETSTTQSFCAVKMEFNSDDGTMYIEFRESDLEVKTDMMNNGIPAVLVQALEYIWNPFKTRFRYGSVWYYMCAANGEDCDKKYVETNAKLLVANVDMQEERTKYEKVSQLLYNRSSNVQQCYTSFNTTDNCTDHTCQYSSYVPFFFRRPQEWICNSDGSGDYSSVRYITARTIPGLKKFEVEALHFDCNIDKCNDPASVATILRIFRSVDSGGCNISIKTNNIINLFIVLSIVLFFST
jgi:hypothetical protein